MLICCVSWYGLNVSNAVSMVYIVYVYTVYIVYIFVCIVVCLSNVNVHSVIVPIYTFWTQERIADAEQMLMRTPYITL